MKKFFLISAAFCLSLVGFSQPCPPGCSGPNCEFCVDPSTIPVDGGSTWILLFGAIIGGAILYKKNKND